MRTGQDKSPERHHFKNVGPPMDKFELQNSDKFNLISSNSRGLMFFPFIIFGLCVLLINDNFRQATSISDIPVFIITILFIVLFIYRIKNLLAIFLSKYKSVIIDNDNQKLIVQAKDSCTIEIPFESINRIDVRVKDTTKWTLSELKLGTWLDYVNIYTTNNENYLLYVTNASKFYEVISKDIKIKRL